MKKIKKNELKQQRREDEEMKGDGRNVVVKLRQRKR